MINRSWTGTAWSKVLTCAYKERKPDYHYWLMHRNMIVNTRFLATAKCLRNKDEQTSEGSHSGPKSTV